MAGKKRPRVRKQRPTRDEVDEKMFGRLHAAAEKSGLAEMSIAEINELIRSTRKKATRNGK